MHWPAPAVDTWTLSNRYLLLAVGAGGCTVTNSRPTPLLPRRSPASRWRLWRRRAKVLVHDGIGVWLAARRLNSGKFVWPKDTAATAEPADFTVERRVRSKWACAHCQMLVQAPVPAHVIDKGIPTAGLLAHLLWWPSSWIICRRRAQRRARSGPVRRAGPSVAYPRRTSGPAIPGQGKGRLRHDRRRSWPDCVARGMEAWEGRDAQQLDAEHDSLVRVADAPSTSLAGRWSACRHPQDKPGQPEQRPERAQLPGRGR
jgi:hypothetical protein